MGMKPICSIDGCDLGRPIHSLSKWGNTARISPDEVIQQTKNRYVSSWPAVSHHLFFKFHNWKI